MTTPRVLTMFPPNYRDIVKAFPIIRGKTVAFAYGGTIYNPNRWDMPPQIIAHEKVHMERQGSDPAGWWTRYIAEPIFRLDEEILAHRAEVHFLGMLSWRDIETIARRLASPLYGNLISVDKAMSLIADGIDAQRTPRETLSHAAQ